MTRTTEQLRKRIRGLEITLQHKNWEAVKADLECMKELLAVREAKSIGFIQDRASGYDSYVLKAFYGANLNIGDKVYTAPPPPAVPDGFKLVPIDMTDQIGEAIAMEANCCGGIALDIYNAALAAAPTPTK